MCSVAKFTSVVFCSWLYVTVNVFSPRSVFVELVFHLIANWAVHVPPFAVKTSSAVGPAAVISMSASSAPVTVKFVNFASTVPVFSTTASRITPSPG